MKLAEMIRKLAGIVGSRFLGAGIGFLSQIVLAHVLPVAEVGVVLLGMSAAAFVSLASIGGYSMLAMTQLPRLSMHGRKFLVRSFNHVVLVDALLSSLAVAALLFVVSKIAQLSEGQNIALLFGCLCAPASGLLRYNSSIATSDRRFELGYVPDFLVRPTLFLLTLLLTYWLGLHLSMVVVLIIFTVITLVTAVGQAWLLGHEGLTFSNYRRPRSGFANRLRSRALALTIVSAVALAFADIVTLVAGFILPTDDVAVVGITIRLAAIAGFVLQAGQIFILPDFTQAFVRRDHAVANALLLRINLTTLAVVGASVIGALLLGEFALSIFGADYVRGAGLLSLFMVGQSIRAFGGMNQHILSINGHQLRTAGAAILAVVMFICLAILFCQSLGFIGIGYAVIFAEISWLLALAAQAQKLCGRRGDLLWVARAVKSS